MAGGTIYQHFELVPKKRYKKCKLIAPYACATAKYIQCLAAGIPVSVPHFYLNRIGIRCEKYCNVSVSVHFS